MNVDRRLVAEAASMTDGASYGQIIEYARHVPSGIVFVVKPGVHMAEMAVLLASEDEEAVLGALDTGDLRCLQGWQIPLEGDMDDWVNALKLDIGYMVQFTGQKLIKD